VEKWYEKRKAEKLIEQTKQRLEDLKIEFEPAMIQFWTSKWATQSIRVPLNEFEPAMIQFWTSWATRRSGAESFPTPDPSQDAPQGPDGEGRNPEGEEHPQGQT
jgi:hypothetical protein